MKKRSLKQMSPEEILKRSTHIPREKIAETFEFVSIPRYAKLAGISRQAVYDRIARGTIEAVEKEDFTGTVRRVISLKKYPAERGKHGRPKEGK